MPDIKYGNLFTLLFVFIILFFIVIDFCLVKELTCDDSTNFQCLKLNWASKASLTQRKGRAGRVSDGRCYRLITENFYIRETEQYSKAEIMVILCDIQLQQLIISLKYIHYNYNRGVHWSLLYCILKDWISESLEKSLH